MSIKKKIILSVWMWNIHIPTLKTTTGIKLYNIGAVAAAAMVRNT